MFALSLIYSFVSLTILHPPFFLLPWSYKQIYGVLIYYIARKLMTFKKKTFLGGQPLLQLNDSNKNIRDCPERLSCQEGGIEIPFSGLTLTHFCAYRKLRSGFQTLYVMVIILLCFQWVSMIGDCLFFCDFGRIDDHHCLHFLCFI